MNDERIQALDPATKLAVVLCDCTAAAMSVAAGCTPRELDVDSLRRELIRRNVCLES